MYAPDGFSWIERPLLAAMARPEGLEELQWLRREGIELLISLTEDPLRRDWINEAGLMGMHLPVEDMQPPSPEQLEQCLSAVRRAHDKNMGVGIHCGAGLGRTGVVVACYLIANKGLSAKNAIARVRRLRPGSIETDQQEEAIHTFEQRQQAKSS